MGAGSSAIVVTALLISGYLFNLNFHPFRYYSNKAEGQKLFFMAAGAGLILGAIVFGGLGLLRSCLASDNLILQVAAAINNAIPVPHASRLLATIFFAVGVARLLNLVSVLLVGGKPVSPGSAVDSKTRSRAQRVYDRLTERDGGAMAQLLRRAVDEQKLVMLTLKSRKIYCGRVFEVPFDLDADRACIEILPSFSTWRDKDNLRMGGARTAYPVIDLWAAKQRLYSVEEQLASINAHVSGPEFVALTNTEHGKKLLRRVRRGLEKERNQLIELIQPLSGGREFDIRDWIKVILIKEIESLSFYDSDAYNDWFADKNQAEEAERVAGNT